MRDSLLTLCGPLDPQRHKANSAPSLLKPMNSPYGLSQLDLSFFHWQLRMLTNSVAKTLKCLNTHTLFLSLRPQKAPPASPFLLCQQPPCLSWQHPARSVPPEPSVLTGWGRPALPLLWAILLARGKRTKEDQPYLVWTLVS